MENIFDLIVIGAGPGGYVSAIKAAKLGMKVAVIENREVGGTCLNRGCIPTKALIHATELYRQMQHCECFGLTAENIGFDIGKVFAYKNGVTAQLKTGIEQLLKANGVTVIRGKGTIEKNRMVKVTYDGNTLVYSGKHILIAAGSKPAVPAIKGVDLPNVLTSDDILNNTDKIYKKLVIIGGGIISVEFATIFRSLGSEVSVIEAMPSILPNMDKEISQNLKMILKKRGIEIHVDAQVEEITKEKELVCHFKVKEQSFSIPADAILVAVGREPNITGLFGEGITPEIERNRILTDDSFETSIKDIYAVGDVIKGMQLAHVASAQGVYVVEKINGEEPTTDLSIIPSCVYTDPEIACVGITADEAKKQNIAVRVGKFITSANGKSLISMEERGFIKVVFDEKTDVILGAQMMCARATDMIGEMATAIANKLTSKQLLTAMRSHPTFNESVTEAIEDCLGGAIHALPKRKR
ncbi:dihydrolipoyl dehydrogenase [Petroclostridium sp. X23]|uniref:dihydrolipoyl dehydrogenase n=1 Tax=Petroclostridium sp. X23 TaxID=3045146 RepID=UPI0024AD81D6|nr:dihydrolipoyl dehydrogenase [Petroclostridium sp. X23]WHH57160.1 dihydrolipoyl dehydrogenase [Petroclostridium sp. X23]